VQGARHRAEHFVMEFNSLGVLTRIRFVWKN
jgi:hypothetical protein